MPEPYFILEMEGSFLIKKLNATVSLCVFTLQP